MENPLKNWNIDRSTIKYLGQDLQRPECILATKDGCIWTADARGVMKIMPDDTQYLISQNTESSVKDENTTTAILSASLPNGITFLSPTKLAIANFGNDHIEHMNLDGKVTTLLSEIEGQPLGKTNFVIQDSRKNLWFSVTTRQTPWTKSITDKVYDGYVAVIVDGKAKIVADGFCGTNEIKFDHNEEWLYVVESNARRISRIRFDEQFNCTDREVYGPENLGGTPDGFAFDSFGNLWVTLILNEKLIAITPEQDVITLLDDGNPEAIQNYENSLQDGTFTPEKMMACKGKIAPCMASITFGGKDLKTVYLGSLLGKNLPYFQSPIAGLPLPHWDQI